MNVNEAEIVANELLMELDKKKMLLRNQYPDKYDLKIFERHVITTSMLLPLFKTRGTSKNQENFLNSIDDFGFKQEHVDLLPWIVELQLLLSSFEMLKKLYLQ